MAEHPQMIAERLFSAVEAGAIDDVREIMAPDVEIWHNHDGIIQTRDENLRVLRWMATHLAGLTYQDVRRSVTATGFVQQHVLQATTVDGDLITVPACIVCTCKDGRITRLDEYLDSAHLAPLLAVAERPGTATRRRTSHVDR